MTVYLDPQQVADRLGVARSTAKTLMMEMNPVPILGTVRKRYRVSEENLNRWMDKNALGRPSTGNISRGSKKKLQRR